MRLLFATCAALALAGPVFAVDLKLPPEVSGQPGAFVTVAAETDGETVVWYPLDAGLNLFPVALLKDTRTAVVTSPVPGRYRLLAVTAEGGVPTQPVVTTVVIGNAPPVPPGPNPPGPTPPPDPIPPPLTGTAKAAYDAAMRVQSATRAQDAAIIAGIYRGAASAGAATSMSPAEMHAKLAADMKTGLPDDRRRAWGPFGVALDPHLRPALATRDATIEALNSVADGLEVVR